MDIYSQLNKLPWKKKEYFLWKFKLNMYSTDKSEEELLRILDLKSFASMRKWERSPEYLTLVNLYIESQIAKDLEKVYQVVQEKAITGDEKSIKLLLDLQKQVRAFNKEVKPTKQHESNVYDELEL
ncbi:MAG TPA: hypothetical protein VNR61_19170 [Niallia sp.]|nr:hypothetical protein [Niallia sp.]